MATTERTFPVMPDARSAPHPTQIPWSVAELAYSVYASRYGRDQSLERLAERGGFAPSELDKFVPGWRTRCEEIEQLRAEIAEARRVLDPETPGHRSPDWVAPQTPLGKRAHEFRGAMELGLRSADIAIQAALRREREQSAELAKFRELARRASDAIRARDTDGLGGCTSRLERDLAAHHKEPAT